MTSNQNAVIPGQFYGLPGVTQRFETPDTTTNDVVSLALSNQVNWNTVQPFQATDVVHWWEFLASWVNNYTLGAATEALSPYAPYNLLQETSIQMQGQYKPINVQSGVDLAIFQSYRPMRGSAQMSQQVNLGANPAATWANSAFPQANQVALPNMSATSTPVPLYLELPASLWFDQYYELGQDGAILSEPISAYVSPQYMAGGQRSVKLVTKYAAGVPSNADTGPIVITGSPTSIASTVTGSLRRVGVYSQNDPRKMPPVFNWQYQRHSFNYPMSGKTKAYIPITDYGQVLSTWVRIFDPTANAPESISNISECGVFYGSNLPRYDDTVEAMQKRFMDQHGFLPPVGTAVWDMGLTDTGGLVTNAKAINTLTNANVGINLEFASALSANAYAVVGVESLVYVAID